MTSLVFGKPDANIWTELSKTFKIFTKNRGEVSFLKFPQAHHNVLINMWFYSLPIFLPLQFYMLINTTWWGGGVSLNITVK